MKRRSREEWQQLIQQQQESGLKASQFCKEHGLCVKYFSTVKHKLKKKAPDTSAFQSGMLKVVNCPSTITVQKERLNRLSSEEKIGCLATRRVVHVPVQRYTV